MVHLVLLTRLRVDFRFWRERMHCCNCGDISITIYYTHTNEIGTTEHYLCPNFCLQRHVSFDNHHRKGLTILQYISSLLTRIVLWDDSFLSDDINHFIMSDVVHFLLHTKSFGSFFLRSLSVYFLLYIFSVQRNP